MADMPPDASASPVSPAGSAARWSRPLIRWLIGALIAIVALAGLFAGFEYVASSNSALAGVCGQLSLTRHGLPCDIPLLSDATYQASSTTTLPEGYPVTGWEFYTNQSPDQIQPFYLNGLRASGWPCAVAKQLGDTFFIFGVHKADRPNTVLEITDDPISAAGQYRLAIALVQGAPLPPAFTCS